MIGKAEFECLTSLNILEDNDLWTDDNIVRYLYWKGGDKFKEELHPLEFSLRVKRHVSKYKNHNALLQRKRAIHRELEHHLVSECMLTNVDFAENLTYNNFPRSVQSAHWKSY